MHTLDCLVAIGGDLMNKCPKQGVTVPELMLLRLVHGESAVTDIQITGNPRVSHTDERDRLMQAYPKHQQLITAIWRDSGGKFPADVRVLQLSPAFFKPDYDAPYKEADRLEEEAEQELKKAKAPRKSRKKAPPEDENVETILDPPPGVDLEDLGDEFA